MQYYKFYSILQKYSKIEQLNCDFSTLEFNEDTYCISLSGGVDSMVLLNILLKRGKNIIAVHLNYNNREESALEAEFLELYCKARNVKFICHSFNFQRGSIKRSDYESITKQIKFKLYKSILAEYNLSSILLAHHKDDIIENIFTNFCRGDNFLNLSVIKQSNTIMDVNIVRPFINYYKEDIYDYAHFYEVPYFLDTTPDWSVRGKFRRNLLPMLCNTFNGTNSLKNNLLSIAKESDEWGTLIKTKFIDKYMSSVKYGKGPNGPKGQEGPQGPFAEMPISIDNEDYSVYPLCFWQEIISKIFHYYGMSSPSRKSLEIFVNALKNKKETKILVKHSIEIKIEKNKIIII